MQLAVTTLCTISSTPLHCGKAKNAAAAHVVASTDDEGITHLKWTWSELTFEESRAALLP